MEGITSNPNDFTLDGRLPFRKAYTYSGTTYSADECRMQAVEVNRGIQQLCGELQMTEPLGYVGRIHEKLLYLKELCPAGIMIQNEPFGYENIESAIQESETIIDSIRVKLIEEVLNPTIEQCTIKQNQANDAAYARAVELAANSLLINGQSYAQTSAESHVSGYNIS